MFNTPGREGALDEYICAKGSAEDDATQVRLNELRAADRDAQGDKAAGGWFKREVAACGARPSCPSGGMPASFQMAVLARLRHRCACTTLSLSDDMCFSTCGPRIGRWHRVPRRRTWSPACKLAQQFAAPFALGLVTALGVRPRIYLDKSPGV